MSEIKTKIEMETKEVKCIIEDLQKEMQKHIDMGSDQCDVNIVDKIADMIKDMTEAKKNIVKACYYTQIMEAMEDSKYGVDYDEYGKLGYTQPRDSMGQYSSIQSRNSYNGSSRPRRMGFKPDYMRPFDNTDYTSDWDDMSKRIGENINRNGMSRYGYSHDEYMNKRNSYSKDDPESMKKRKDLLNVYLEDLISMGQELVEDMAPEEKQIWKVKLNKLINM